MPQGTQPAALHTCIFASLLALVRCVACEILSRGNVSPPGVRECKRRHGLVIIFRPWRVFHYDWSAKSTVLSNRVGVSIKPRRPLNLPLSPRCSPVGPFSFLQVPTSLRIPSLAYLLSLLLLLSPPLMTRALLPREGMPAGISDLYLFPVVLLHFSDCAFAFACRRRDYLR